ncbi:hypothetical protein Anapl_04747 [Anas platyrhynchos]|uniref:Uncharacterized protein n=1 Tax=Anas platyrhynchos TaxID=8839 RepID=R0LZ42_ANAPL|nr:hypothetical protein Anapl_04747 [Anas platyrhynchos]
MCHFKLDSEAQTNTVRESKLFTVTEKPKEEVPFHCTEGKSPKAYGDFALTLGRTLQAPLQYRPFSAPLSFSRDLIWKLEDPFQSHFSTYSLNLSHNGCRIWPVEGDVEGASREHIYWCCLVLSPGHSCATG